MKKTILNFESRILIALVGAALAGCTGAPAESEPAAAHGAAPAAVAASQSVADRIVAANAQAERDMHLIARKHLNNDTEIVEFYEPVPGQIMVSIAGSPQGPSQVHMAELRTKPAAEIWAALAPGEELPRSLSDAIARQPGVTYTSAAADRAKQQAADRGETPAAPAAVAEPVVSSVSNVLSDEVAQPRPAITPLATNLGYCSQQFYTDFGNESANAGITSATFNYGWYQTTRNASSFAEYVVCPTGDVSNTGGRFTVTYGNGATGQWEIAPNYYRAAWSSSTAVTCDWTFSCYLQGMGDWCTPVTFSLTGRFDSDCYLNKGTSCGDDFGVVNWGVNTFQYCQTPNFN
jgi:hypothetical protein